MDAGVRIYKYFVKMLSITGFIRIGESGLFATRIRDDDEEITSFIAKGRFRKTIPWREAIPSTSEGDYAGKTSYTDSDEEYLKRRLIHPLELTQEEPVKRIIYDCGKGACEVHHRTARGAMKCALNLYLPYRSKLRRSLKDNRNRRIIRRLSQGEEVISIANSYKVSFGTIYTIKYIYGY